MRFKKDENPWRSEKSVGGNQERSLEPQPFWGYEDIGIFLLLTVVLGLIVRLLVRSQFLTRSSMDNPSVALQSAVVTLLGAGFYFVIRLRYRQPVLKPLGWIVPQTPYIVIALMAGPSFAAGIALYLRLRNQVCPPIPINEVLILGLVLGPILEESFFRGCLMPLLAQSMGSIPAIIIAAAIFAIFHGPTNLGHCLTFTATGIAYGWVRMASGSTTAPALMHAAYNLTFGLLAGA
ncbi:MAG TPA: CPBP family intramembrane glutamic endopeptidase [Terriglobales bacterium]|nr:CPBP family intramembrane glutamic endopeptidase [Terriglobales bacterium]